MQIASREKLSYVSSKQKICVRNSNTVQKYFNELLTVKLIAVY